MHRRRIVWADSDPAGIAYTGRFAAFALEAIEAWCAERLGVSWFASHGSGTIMPFVHMDLDFRAPLRPDDELLTTVLLDKAGRSSVATRVTGRLSDGTVSFEGRFVQVFVGAGMAPVSIPPGYAERLASERALADAA